MLVAVEYALFSAAFESGALRQRTDAWAWAGYLGSLGVFVAVAGMGALFVGNLGKRDRADERRSALSLGFGRPADAVVAWLLAAHLSTLILLWWITARVVSDSGPPAGSPAAWLLLWCTLMAVAPLLALAAAVPEGALHRLLPALLPQVLSGAAVGAGAWLAGIGSARLWWPLGPWTMNAVTAILRTVGEPHYDTANAVIGTARFEVVISPQCAGFEGLGLTMVFVTSYLVLARERLRFPRAWLLLPLGVIASLVANVLRLVLLILVGSFVSPDIAAAGFHARAGWLFFAAVALGLVLLARRADFFSLEPVDVSFDTPTSAYLLPFLSLVTVGLLTGLAVVDIDYWYWLRIAGAALVLYAYRGYYADAIPRGSVLAVLAGVVAAAGFIVLAPTPSVETVTAWRMEWQTLSPLTRVIWLATRVAGSVLIVPLAEELAFRGYVQRRVMAVDFQSVSPAHASWLAVAISACTFGTVHAGWLAGIFAGLVYGIVQWRGGSLSHAVTAHIVSNLVVAAYVIGLGQWWLWI